MKRQRGLAAVTALLIVAIAASTAALMLSQQSAMLDQSSMVVARAQADTYAQAGVDWARGILAEDGRKGNLDTLDEPWAQPIAALPVERAVVSGVVVDEQGKFNLNNLGPGRTRADEDTFQTLLQQLGLPTTLRFAVQDWIDADADLGDSSSGEDAYYLSLARPYRAANQRMVHVDELYRIRGFDAATVAKLRPFVTALPEHTRINVNTASDQVLHAVLGDVAPERLAQLLAKRAAHPFQTVEAFARESDALVGGTAPRDALDVGSQYFAVRVQVAQDDVQLASDALLQRRATDKGTVIIWRRPRY